MDTRKASGKQTLDSKPSPDQTIWHNREIAVEVLYLTSSESAFVLGAELIVDGGMATHPLGSDHSRWNYLVNILKALLVAAGA